MSRSKFIFTISVALLLFAGKGATAAIPSGRLNSRFFEMGKSEVLRGTVWGALAVTSDGDTLVNVNGGLRMVPASNMKLITTGCALCRLGQGFRFRTSLAHTGEVENGILRGDIYIIGGGDPSLCDRYVRTGDSLKTFASWNGMISDCGISGIEGKVIGDSRYFDQDNIEDSWSFEDICDDYSCGVSGLSIGNNLSASPAEASLHCARQFTEFLRENGISVSQEASDSTEVPSDSLVLMGSTESVTLGDLIYVANHESENIYAEAFFRQLGRDLYGKSDYETSAKALCSILGGLGLGGKIPEIMIVDGSGLSRKNCISPDFFVSFLRAMSLRKEFNTFLHSLPVPGTGTLKRCLKDQPQDLKSRIYMKSGTMEGTRCFSGYILPSGGGNGKMIAFSIMTNNVVGNKASLASVMDDMIELLASEN